MIKMDIQDYCKTLSDKDSEILEELKNYAYNNEKMYKMISGSLVGNFLKMSVNMLRANNVLELGTYMGYSAIKMAEGLTSETGKIHTCELMEEHVKTAQSFIDKSPYKNNIVIHHGNALDILETFPISSFDVAFIDADKINYLNYYKRCVRLVKHSGYIILDNMFWGGEALNPKNEEARAIRETAEYINSDNRVSNYIIPIRDGLMVAYINE